MLTRKFDKVFCVGLPKTGTTTLGRCLQIVGYNKAPYDQQLIEHYARDPGSLDLKYVLERYSAFEDWPYPLIYSDLHRLEPKSGFILSTRRDASVWLQSVQMHTERNPSDRSKELRKAFFGASDPFQLEEVYTSFYENHNQEVRDYFAKSADQFLELCWEEGDGWEQLCEFLDVPAPSVTTIPHENSASSSKRRARNYIGAFKHLVRRSFAPKD